MNRQMTLTLCFGAAMILAACAQTEPAPQPAPIMPEPVFDKYGNEVDGGGGGCAGGTAGAANCVPLTPQTPGRDGGGGSAGGAGAAGAN